MRRRGLILALASLPMAARAQKPDGQGETARLEAVRSTIATHILPGQAGFATAATAFAAATQALEQAPDTAHAEATRRAWIEAALAFQRIRHLRFGPMEAFDHGFRLSIFPDLRNVTGREVADLLRRADPATLTDAAFRSGRVAGQGFPAAERLLFGDYAARLLRPDQGFRRLLLAAIGRNIASIAAEMQGEWTQGDPPYARVLEGSPGGPYRDAGEGLLVLFKSLHGGLEFLSDRQVARSLGASVQAARPRSAEAWRSGQSLALAQASLAALAELQATAIAPLLQAADPVLAQATRDGMADARRLAHAIAPSLEAAVTTQAGRAAVEELVRALGSQRRLLTERVAPAIGLPVGFNAMDGD